MFNIFKRNKPDYGYFFNVLNVELKALKTNNQDSIDTFKTAMNQVSWNAFKIKDPIKGWKIKKRKYNKRKK